MSPDPSDALRTHLGRLARAFACGVLATVVLCATARPVHAAGPLASALQRVRASSAVGRVQWLRFTGRAAVSDGTPAFDGTESAGRS